MKRRITLSIALALSIVVLSLMSWEPTVNAAAARRYFADSGMVTLGPNQLFRVTVANTSSQRSLTVTFTAQFTSVNCVGGVCTHTVASQTTTSPVTLAPGQAASHDIIQPPSAAALRAIVAANSPDMQVNGLIIDATTGQVEGNGLLRFYGDIAGDR
jgi:hypothetical protein